MAMEALVVVVAALLVDAAFGEPQRGHPLVAFGRAAQALERRLNRDGRGSRVSGVLALGLLVMPPLALAGAVTLLATGWLQAVCAIAVLSLAIGWRSLREHARAVAMPLMVGELTEARRAVARMVSRDSTRLDAEGVAKAATESVLENGADAIFASIFWFLVAGMPGVVLHRLVNTLDAMWGYRNARFERFGWAAARLDDGLNWVPARLCAASYAMSGRLRAGLRCWRSQARAWESPNAGPVMATGAGALGLQLGGDAPYATGWRQRPMLGHGRPPTGADISAAVRLVDRAVVLWVVVLLVFVFVSAMHQGGLGGH